MRLGGGTLEETAVFRTLDEKRLEQLPHQTEREVALQFTGSRSQTRKSSLGGALARDAQQARLADPGWRLDETT